MAPGRPEVSGLQGPTEVEGVSPQAAPHPCNKFGCPNLVPRGKSHCEAHKSEETPTQRGSWAHRETPAQRGYGYAWTKLRAWILARDGYRCVECGGPAKQVDHVRPKSQAGSDAASNLVSRCTRCHGRKSGREGRAAQPK
jgi:5-methylcytosine-specific restriction enzyme A